MKNLPFEQLGQMPINKGDDAAAQSKPSISTENENLKNRFLKLVEGNYDKIPMGWQLTSDLKGINSITILRAPGESFSVYIYYKAKNEKDQVGFCHLDIAGSIDMKGAGRPWRQKGLNSGIGVGLLTALLTK